MRITTIAVALCLCLQLYGRDFPAAGGPFAEEMQTTEMQADTVAVQGALADTVQLSGASVTAQGAAHQIRQGAFAATAVEVGRQVALLQSLSQAVSRTSGVRIRTQGGVGSDYDLALNGLSGNSVRYFIDGIALETKGSGVNLSNLPLNTIDHVEIYKGVIPATLGSDALGGAINIVTNRRSLNYLDFSYGAGSFNTHRADFSAQYKTPKAGIIIKPSVGLQYSRNNYLMRGVKVRNEDHSAFIITDLPRFHDAYGSMFVQLEAGVRDRSWADDFFVSASLSVTGKQVQTGATQSHVVGMATRNSRALNLTARYAKRFTDAFQLSALVSHTLDHSQTIDTTLRQYYWDGTYIDGAYSEIRGRGRTLRNYFRPLTIARTTLDYKLAQGHSLTLNYMLNVVENRQSDGYDKTFAPTNDVMARNIIGLAYSQSLLDGRLENVFFLKDYLDRLRVGQSEMASQTGADKVELDATRNYLGYGAGGRLRISEPLQVKLSYEHSVRLPVSREMLGNGTTVYPNLTLKPETGNNFNLGAFGTLDLGDGHLISYEANGFIRLVDNYIQANVMESEGMMQYTNVAAVHIKGVEGEIQYNWAGRLFLAANASYDSSRDMRQYTQSGTPSVTYLNRTPNRPWTFCNLSAAYTFYNFGFPDGRLRIGANYQWVHWFYVTWAAYGSAAGKPIVPTQHLTDAALLYSWHGGRYNISLECTNLFDTLAYDNYMLQKPGRAFFLKFNYYLCKR